MGQSLMVDRRSLINYEDYKQAYGGPSIEVQT